MGPFKSYYEHTLAIEESDSEALCVGPGSAVQGFAGQGSVGFALAGRRSEGHRFAVP